ncbi:MAG: hypothetical protein FXF47_06480 [Candidatus Mcinerneyibacterium aminivorans]|uniref:Uncharacterized protein n=1 Tax=Candidatus Mcinerneyibacterium aminivorans TaxID=2703815 RepID=A0A5D0MBB1_9BACT|nr:MAG: hypothetical protein FXF47_06480 [Candidatus Mcinerneyibacterium aminivorans]
MLKINNKGASLVEYIASLVISLVIAYLFVHTIATIYLITFKEAKRGKGGISLKNEIEQQIMAEDYANLDLLDGTTGQILLDDRGTDDTSDDIMAEYTINISTVSDNYTTTASLEYKRIEVEATWPELIVGSERDNPTTKTEEISFILRRYQNVNY